MSQTSSIHVPESFHFGVVAWGKRYVDMFLQVTLPSHLSPGNIPAFVNHGIKNSTYHICTTSSDSDTITQSEVFKKLNRYMDTSIHLIDSIVSDPENDKYLAMTKAQELVLVEAVKAKGAAIILGPHGVLSDGTIMRFKTAAFAGKRVLVWGSFRAEAEKVMKTLIEGWYSPEKGDLCISSRDLVKVGYDNLHPAARHFFWDSGQFPNDGPAVIHWDLPGKGILMRCAHMGPMMVFPDTDVERFGNNTLDGGDYVYREFGDFDDIHIIRDSDEAFALTMSFEDFIDVKAVPKEQPDILRILSWYGNRTVTTPYHLRFFQERLFLHFDDLDESISGIVEQSDMVVRSIVSGLESRLLIDEASRLTWANKELNDRVDSLARSSTGLRTQRRALIFDGVNTCLELHHELIRFGEKDRAGEVLDRAFRLLIPLITVYRSADNDSLGMFSRLLGLCDDMEKKESYLKAAGPESCWS